MPRALDRLKDVDFSYIQDFDPIAQVNSRDNFPQAKKDKYVKQIIKEAARSELTPGSFSLNLKGGEVYTCQQQNLGDDFYVRDVDERPRTLCNPSDEYCGLLTVIQTLFWPALKKIFPGFIQGYTKK